MIIFLLSHTPCSQAYDVDDADDAGDDEVDDDGSNDAWVMQA